MCAYLSVKTVWTSHQETATAVIAKAICSFLAVSDKPLTDFNRKIIATRLTIDAVIMKINSILRLESCSLAIFFTSMGCDVRMIIQSSIITVNAQPIHDDNASSGTVSDLSQQK